MQWSVKVDEHKTGHGGRSWGIQVRKEQRAAAVGGGPKWGHKLDCTCSPLMGENSPAMVTCTLTFS